MRSFKSNENIHKKEDGSYYVVSAFSNSDTRSNIQAIYIYIYIYIFVQKQPEQLTNSKYLGTKLRYLKF